MAFGESYVQRQARLDRQRKAYPELEGSDYDTIGKVDALRRSEGRPLTTFGQAVEDTYIGIQQEQYNPDTPDTAPNVEGWTPQPMGRPAFDYFNPRDVLDSPVGFERGAPSSSINETLRNVGGVFNPLSENSVFGTATESQNPLLQELLRPANYIPVGRGATALRMARGAAGGVAGRAAGEAANKALEDAPAPLRVAGSLGAALLGGGAGIAAVDGLPRAARAADQALNPANLRAAAPEAFQRGRGTLDDAGRLRAAAVRPEDTTPRLSLAGADDAMPAIPEPESTNPLAALMESIKAAKPLQAQNAEKLHQFRSRQAGAFAGALGEGEGGFNRALGAMRGQADRVGFTPLRPVLGQEGVDSLFGALRRAGLSQFDHASAGTALRNVMDGVVPVDSELAKLEEAFPGLTKALRDAKIIAGPSVGDYVKDIVALPQSLLSSFDLSAFRQVGPAAAGNKRMAARSFRESLKALASEDAYQRVNDDLARRWYNSIPNTGADGSVTYRNLTREAGIAKATAERGLSRGEGTIISTLVNQIGNRSIGTAVGAREGYRSADEDAPTSEKLLRAAIGGAGGFAVGTAANKAGVGGQVYRASQRAYSTMINLMRDGLLQKMIAGYGGNPAEVPEEVVRQWGRMINVSTGRGDVADLKVLGQQVPDVVGAMTGSKVAGNPVFWAPRLIASRVQLPLELLSSNAQVRKEVANQIVSFVTINSTLLGAGAAAGMWEVSLDPKSADFGQLRIGNQRIDPWVGFRPIANLVARMATGEVTSTTSGQTYEKERKQIIADFLRQKFSPVSGAAVSLWTGEDAIGQPYGAGDAAEALTTPLLLRDIEEALKVEGLKGLPGAATATFGAGVNTYESAPSGRAQPARLPRPPRPRPPRPAGTR